MTTDPPTGRGTALQLCTYLSMLRRVPNEGVSVARQARATGLLSQPATVLSSEEMR
jgi:hypothetical protein